jgi:hypothetical protein
MLESLFFISLVIIGTLTLAGVVFLYLIGLVNKSNGLKKISSYFLIIPGSCFGLIALFYFIIQPLSFSGLANQSTGKYYVADVSPPDYFENIQVNTKDFSLILNNDGSFSVDSIPGLGIPRSGLWNTGGIDGMFEFKDINGNIEDFASHYGSKEDFILEFRIKFQDWSKHGFIRFKRELTGK